MAEADFVQRRMEIRKIQKTGGSSYVITLPKEWLNNLVGEDQEQNLKKEDEEKEDRIKGMKLGVIIQPDNTLLITSNLSGKRIQRRKTIYLEETPDTTYLFRFLISAYMAGYTKIEIKSKNQILAPYRLKIRDFIQQIIGCEVIEEKDNYILIKDLLNPEEMTFESIIIRMCRTAKNMHESAIRSLKNRDKVVAETIKLTDDDVDRLHWLVTRLTNMLLRDPALSGELGITPEAAANMFLISRIIERIADHAVRISENVIPLINRKLDERIIDDIESSINTALNVFQISIDSLFERDIQKANENIESINRPEDQSKYIMNYAFQQESILAIPLDNIVESIRRIIEYSHDISESVINFLVRD